jgi:hypothetical protein
MRQKTNEKRSGMAPCTCMKDGFEALPPELRPRSKKKSNLRQVTCPCCGLVYSTNRDTNLCMKCEKSSGL